MPTPQPSATGQVNAHKQMLETLADPETYATTLVVIFTDRYGTEGLQWAPETIRMQMQDDFGVELPGIGFDRLMAAIAILTTDYFYKNLSRFLDLCNVLGGNDFDPSVVVPADVLECAWGITEAMLLQPPDFREDPEPFCDDIRHYLTAALKNEGFIRPPDVLRIAIDADFSAQVTTDWSDDPDMYGMMFQSQSDKTAQVTSDLKENLRDLMLQLESLQLQNGSTRDIVSKVRAALAASDVATQASARLP